MASKRATLCDVGTKTERTSSSSKSLPNIAIGQKNFTSREDESVSELNDVEQKKLVHVEPTNNATNINVIESNNSDCTRLKPKSKDLVRSNSSPARVSFTKGNSDLNKFEIQKIKLARELDNLEIHWPGGGKIKFNDHDSLKKFMESQYPDWKNSGHKTSIPCVRMPRMMIRNEQLSKKLQACYKSHQKGEIGESKIYKLFVNEVKTDDSGILIFPNVDGSHYFKKGGPGSVEIDMIVAHPTKGIFVFNVKNERNPKIQDLKSDMQKHSDFVRYLMCYNCRPETSSNYITGDFKETNQVPIHAVFCLIPDIKYPIDKLAEDTKWYTQGHSDRQFDRVIVFRHSHLFNNFSEHWEKTVRALPSIEKSYKFDALIALLSALSSMTGNSALIHHRIASNDMQSIQVKTNNLDDWYEKQLEETSLDEGEKSNLICYNKELCKKSRGQKTKVILWTKEQLDIIGRVFKSLTDPSSENNPLRLHVKGAKGSGKTMLMVYLAQLAKHIFQDRQSKSKVVLCDLTSDGAPILFSNLKQTLDGSGIEFWTKLDVSEKIDSQDIIFFDEDPLNYISARSLLQICFVKGAHTCLFSSIEMAYIDDKLATKFKNLFLLHAMRSTKRVQAFSSNVSKNLMSATDQNEINCSPTHSLDGTNTPDIIYVKATIGSQNESFFQKSVETVMKYTDFSLGMSRTLVVINFLPPKSQFKFISLLKTRQISLRSFSYDLDHDESKANLPIIQVESTYKISGSEFGTVVILLEKKVISPLTQGWIILPRTKFLREFYKAVTRATTNLAIVASDISLYTSTLDEKEISDAVRIL